MALWLRLWTSAMSFSSVRARVCRGRAGELARIEALALDRLARPHGDGAVPGDGEGVAAQRRQRAGERGAFAFAIVGRAMHRAVELPMLLLPGEQPVHMGAPARQRMKAALEPHQEEAPLHEGLDRAHSVIGDIAADDIADLLLHHRLGFRAIGLDLVAMAVGIEHVDAALADGAEILAAVVGVEAQALQ